ncbi:hypothetical protein Lal_00010216 [Lupinus albus]|uniref:Uncharacterized protein n=1 Tax=Lupinus albus TaxID=3870 RepID=A0A6A4NF53_LUPAL|nr:hypothetical protein Lalb_Chr24g0396521 [Lupinus albus]KAF1859632.1 hypothetical protein Lal_00010216 [Lupinus albus]
MVMEFRSKSCKDETLQIESYNGGRVVPTNMQYLKCYSANYASYAHQIGKEVKIKKGNNTVSKGWNFNDPELKRKKRIVGYKVYDTEGKMKGSLRKSFKWIKNTYSQAIYGFW